MLRLAFDFIITWRETRTRPNAYLIRIFLLPADRWMETDGFGARLRNDPIIMNTWLVHRWRARWSVV